MKVKGFLLSVLLLLGCFGFMGCDDMASTKFEATIYVSIPEEITSYRFSSLINKNEQNLNDSNTMTEGKIVQENSEINTFLKDNFPNSKIWNNNSKIVRYSFASDSLKSTNNSFKIFANIDGEDYFSQIDFDYLATDRVYDGISEFREITLENSNGKKYNALFIYYYKMWV